MTADNQEVSELMRALFEDLGLDGASDSEIEDLIAIHGRALGGCALEFQTRLETQAASPKIPAIQEVLEKIRVSSFDSPVSGKALIHELIGTVSAESLRFLLLASHLAIRAAGARAQQKQISLIEGLDDVVMTIGQKAANGWDPAGGDAQEEWCRSLFTAAQSTAELTTGMTFFRDESD